MFFFYKNKNHKTGTLQELEVFKQFKKYIRLFLNSVNQN